MSKLIIDMPMPKRCGVCKCRHVEFDIDRVAVFCAIMDNRFVKDFDSIPSWCPIKGVLPEEHGDLIDRDSYLKLLESYKESKRGVCENKEFIVALQAISKQIKCVKAVIAAERKDDAK